MIVNDCSCDESGLQLHRSIQCARKHYRERLCRDNIGLLIGLLANLLTGKREEKKNSNKLYEYICGKHGGNIGGYSTRLSVTIGPLCNSKKARFK